MAESSRRAIFVLGMHRSGTSVMARALALSGCALPHRLMEANSANPTGYWEPAEAADLDDAVLADLDSSWSDAFGPRHHRSRSLYAADHLAAARKVLQENYGAQDLIVFKEPRATLLVDLWRSAAREEGYQPYFVIMVRHPEAVARSLAAREEVSRNRSLILWATYMLAAETWTRHDKRAIVGFDQLIAGPEAVLDKLEAAFGFVLPRRTWTSANEIERFIKAEHIHHRPLDGVPGEHFRPVESLFAWFEGQAEGRKANADVPADVAVWLEGLEETMAPMLNQADASSARATRLETAQAEAAEARALLAAAAAKAAAVATAHAQRAAELRAELDAALRKAADVQWDLTDKLDGAKGEIERASERIMSLEAERAALEARAAGGEATLTQLRRAVRKTQKSLKRDLAEANAAGVMLEERVNALNALLSEAEARPIGELQSLVLKRAVRIVGRRLGLGPKRR